MDIEALAIAGAKLDEATSELAEAIKQLIEVDGNE